MNSRQDPIESNQENPRTTKKEELGVIVVAPGFSWYGVEWSQSGHISRSIICPLG